MGGCPVDVRITGADQLGDLGKRLRSAGEDGKGLRKELYRGINRATKPAKADAKAAAARELPQRGGLARLVASSRFSTRTRTGGRNVGVSIVAKGTAVRTTDRGFLRHPVFGNREVWVTQRVDPGWFTETLQKSAPKVRREVLDAMRDVAEQIARGGR